jgi:hypothetical protein
MAIGLVGLPWPDVDEDELRNHAEHLRAYASSLSDTHGTAHAQIINLSGSYSGPSYEALAERWGRVSASHMHELIEGCRAFATALDVAAETVEFAKKAILTALGAMILVVGADQIAAVMTLGLAEAASLAAIATAKAVVKSVLDQLEQAAIGAALQAAIGPLEDKLAVAVQGMVLHGVEAALA